MSCLDKKCRVDFGVNHKELFKERTLALKTQKEFAMTTLSNVERMNLSNANALRRVREHLKVTKVELAQKLCVSVKTIDRLESGETQLTEHKILEVLDAMGMSMENFLRAKKGRPLVIEKREKLVTENEQRRSYRKIITKEVQALKTLRRMKGISQDFASSLCGYARPSIGHIENGRIELNQDRIIHIVSSYGFDLNEFNRLMAEEVPRERILEDCQQILVGLKEEKLKIVYVLLRTF